MKSASKRIARSRAVLDEDDLDIFAILYSKHSKKSSFEGSINLEEVRKKLNFSQKGIGLHIKKLVQYGWVDYFSSPQNHRIRLIALNREGISLFEELLKSKKIRGEE